MIDDAPMIPPAIAKPQIGELRKKDWNIYILKTLFYTNIDRDTHIDNGIKINGLKTCNWKSFARYHVQPMH